MTRFPPGTGKAMPTKHPLHRKQVYLHDPRVVYTQQRVNESKAGQGVLLVTEPFSELNAGLIVIFGSSHPPLFHWADWKQYWIQSGLALSPLMATCTQYSLDFCLAWALIGEWTSRILFPVPKGPWPRHGHAAALLPEYRARSPRIVAWARAAL